MEQPSLIKLDKATQMLAEIRSVDDAKQLIDLAEAARVYARQVDLGLEAQNYAAEIKLRAQRRAGEVLQEMEKNVGGRPTENRLQPVTGFDAPQTYAELDIHKRDAHNWQTIAAMPEQRFETYIAEMKDDGEELTTAGILRAARPAHVSYSSGENEWYTPPAYIEAARRVMGCIDIDPASSVIANRVVRATIFYDIESDGLAHEWNGRVWLNPPYAQPLVVHFADKLAIEVDAGRVKQACVLVNNATETVWFQTILLYARAMCLPRGRIKFIDQNGEATGAPLQGQVILYFGPNVAGFSREFEQFGKIMYAE